MREYLPEPVYRASTFKPEPSRATWNQALAALPRAHALQSWAWGDFKSRWGWEPLRYTMTVAQSSWEPLAAAQVMKRRVPGLPFSILYVPRGPALDYQDKTLREQVLAQLEKIARRERAIFIKIDPGVARYWGEERERSNPVGASLVKLLKARGWRYSAEQIQFPNTVELDLTQSEEDLLAAMKSKTRYNIRLAGRKDVTVREGTPVDFDTVLAMYQETAARDGFAIRPADYYRDAWQTLHDAGMAQVLLAEYEGLALGAVVLVRFGPRTIYMYGASTDQERQRMPNYLLQWEAIRWAKRQGCTVYDFWGAPSLFEDDDPLWGVWRFKAGFRGEVVWHVGAWDYPVSNTMYRVYTQLLPRYLAILRGRRATSQMA